MDFLCLSDLVSDIQEGRGILRPVRLASRRDGEQDREAGRGGPRGAGGENGRQPGEEFNRTGAEGAREPTVSVSQVSRGCYMLQQSYSE